MDILYIVLLFFTFYYLHILKIYYMAIINIKAGNLITSKEKYHATLEEINNNELSFSFTEPCMVTYCPDVRKYLIQDGNHRAIEKIMKGDKIIQCQINTYVPRYYPTGDYVTINNKVLINIS